MVPDLQEIRLEVRGREAIFLERTRVSHQKDSKPVQGQPEHERAIVLGVGAPEPARRTEDPDRSAPDFDRLSFAERSKTGAPRASRFESGRLLERAVHRPGEVDGAHRESFQERGKRAHVVAVKVREEEMIDSMTAHPLQRGLHTRRVNRVIVAGVDENRLGRRGPDDGGIALADIDHVDARRGRGRAAEESGGQTDEDHRLPGRSQGNARQRVADREQGDRGPDRELPDHATGGRNEEAEQSEDAPGGDAEPGGERKNECGR